MDASPSAYKKLLFWLLVIMLVFAPLFRAGNLPLPLLILESLGLCLFVLLLFRQSAIEELTSGQMMFMSALMLLPLVSLLPVQWQWWLQLPGRAGFAPIYENIGFNAAEHPISIVPHLSEAALWALIPPLAVFAGTINQPRSHIMKLLYLMLAMAAFQSLLSLMQFGGGLGNALLIDNEYHMKVAAGTYLNRDHLAGFLEMVFPVILALLAATVGKHHFDAHKGSRWRKRMDFLTTLKGHQASVYGILAVLVILALVFTRSRAGVGLTMIGLLLVLMIFARRLGGGSTLGTYGSILAVIMVLTIEIGLAPILDRFSVDPVEDLRFTIYSTALKGVLDFMPLGSGAGTFPDVYPYYQPSDLGLFINRAHNDYLEWIFNAGLPALVLIVLGFAMVALGWYRLWIPGKWRTFRYVQAGAGVGVLLMLLHTLVDFNLHKPANAIYFAFLLAVFFKRNTEEVDVKAKTRKRVRTRRMSKPSLPVDEHKPRKDVPLDDW